MKKKFLSVLFLLLFVSFGANVIGQVSITNDDTNADPSAMLDVKSTDKGVLIPRMTTNQRTMISSPAQGLLVFDTDTGSFWFYDATWQNLSGSSGGGSSLPSGTNGEVLYHDGSAWGAETLTTGSTGVTSVDNRQPYVGLTYLICINGLYPSNGGGGSAEPPFLGQVTLWAGNFAPSGWAKCEGQLLSISTNQALFSILGTTYGGDGQTTFALPDLRGRVSIGSGSGPGLSSFSIGAKGGIESNTNVPIHTHSVIKQ